MKKVACLIVAAMLSLGAMKASDFTLKVTVKGLPLYPVLLTDFYGDKNAILDTVLTDKNGTAIFKLPAKQHAGMYKFVFSDDKFIDFIFNRENVEIETDIRNVNSSVTVVNSAENKVYFGYLKWAETRKTKQEMLLQMLEKYPPDDPFYASIEKQYDKEGAASTRYLDSIHESFGNTLAEKVIKVKNEVIPGREESETDRVSFKKLHWFDGTNFNDTMLLYTGVYTSKIIDYLTLYASKYYQPQQQIQAFKSGIDTVLAKAKANKTTYNFVVDFLFNGFEQMGNGELVEYVAARYSDENTCEHDGSTTTLERKVLTYTKLKVGADAPPFSATTDNGQRISLDDYANRTFILVFWATWCPHCQQTLPEIKNLFDSRTDKSCDMITVSLDTSKVELKTYLSARNFSTTKNICDARSWDGAMATDYHVYSTPTILVVKNRKIVGRPSDMESLKRILREAGIL